MMYCVCVTLYVCVNDDDVTMFGNGNGGGYVRFFRTISIRLGWYNLFVHSTHIYVGRYGRVLPLFQCKCDRIISWMPSESELLDIFLAVPRRVSC